MNNYTRHWFFTWETNASQKRIPEAEKLIKFFDFISDYCTFQKECGIIKGKEHWQGAFTLSGLRRSKRSVLDDFKSNFKSVGGLTLQRTHSGEAAESYVTKEETRIEGPFYAGRKEKYSNEVSMKTKLRPWQRELFEFLKLKKADEAFRSRKVIWIEDKNGNSGKSYFLKWLRTGQKDLIARKLPVNSVDRLISAVSKITEKEKVDLLMVDLTRTQGEDQSFKDLFAALEDVKNGYITDVMYGKYHEAVFEPPMVVIFTNFEFREFSKFLSADRWVWMLMNREKQIEILKLLPNGFSSSTLLSEELKKDHA